MRKTSWIGRIVDPGQSFAIVVVVAAAYGGILFGLVIGLVEILSPGHHFGRTVLNSRQAWVLSIETAWVLFFGAWSTRALRSLPEDIRPALRVERSCAYDDDAVTWWNRVSSPWVPLAAGVLIDFGLSWWFFTGTGWHDYFGQAWTATASHATAALILFIPAGPLLATMIWGFVSYFAFVLKALKNELVLIPDLAVQEMRAVTTFGLFTGLGWSVAVALGVWFFDHKLRWANEALLCLLGAMGVVLIVGPQVLAHNSLVRVRGELLKQAAEGLPGRDAADWVTRNVDRDGPSRRRLEFVKDLRAMPVWIYSPTQALVLLAEVALPVATFVLKR